MHRLDRGFSSNFAVYHYVRLLVGGMTVMIASIVKNLQDQENKQHNEFEGSARKKIFATVEFKTVFFGHVFLYIFERNTIVKIWIEQCLHQDGLVQSKLKIGSWDNPVIPIHIQSLSKNGLSVTQPVGLNCPFWSGMGSSTRVLKDLRSARRHSSVPGQNCLCKVSQSGIG